LRIDGDADAPLRRIRPRSGIALARIDKRFQLRAIEIAAHHSHALAVAPIELSALLVDLHLLWCERCALWNDDPAILPVEVDALDRAVVQAGNTHVGPVDVTSSGVHRNAIGQSAIGNDNLSVGAVRIHRMNAATAQLENE
ncbi:MAG TPA: hypothetical protein VMM15_36090, partial [Bradyrhizobium sp.]|nr:hypothetical protein [Bradyrhizobium sp.]